MPFNNSEYQNIRSEIESMIKASHEWQKHEGFILDGIIDPPTYDLQAVKILLVLGESYGYSRCGMIDIEDQAEDDIFGIRHPNRQTTKKVAMLLSLIFQSLKEGRQLTNDDFPYLLENKKEYTDELQEALLKGAWINVRKASKDIEGFGNDATRQNDAEVYGAGIRNKEILVKQIRSISPDLVIVCGVAAFNCLYDIEALGVGITKGAKYKVQINDIGQKIIQVDHPGYYTKWNYKGILEMSQIIFQNI